MKFRFLTKTPQHKRFDYSPRYYDERKERLEQKKMEYQRLEDGNLDPDERKNLLRRNMQDTWARSKNLQVQQKAANFRVILLILIIVVVGYFFLNGIDQVDTVVKKLW